MPWYQRWRNVFRSEHLNDQLDNELHYHLAETEDRLVDAGMTAIEARREARRRLGNYSTQKEKTRDMNVAAWLDETRADINYGLRQLRANPGFACVAVLSLALGIGANTSIFQLINAVRLKTLPVKNPQELVALDFEKGSTRPGHWWTSTGFSSAMWEQIRTEQQGFSDVIAWNADQFNLAAGGETRMVDGLYVSGNFFRTLGVGAVLGRTFTGQDDSAACNAGAVLSYDFWQREFGGDANALRQTVSLNGRVFSIIGVTAPAFFGVDVGKRFGVAIPLCADRAMEREGSYRAEMPAAYWLSIMGRLRPGWSAPKATAYLNTLSSSVMRASLPSTYDASLAKRFLQNKLSAVEAGTGLSYLRQQYERPLWLLLAITGLVLLIACANLANLLFARATVREKEIAVRLAMGASRLRIIKQLLAESLLLATAGSLSGVALASVLSRSLVVFISTADNPLFVDLALDWRMLGFTASLGILTCLLFGLLPAWRATLLSPAAAIRSSGRSATASRGQSGLRRALVATQVALSLVLLFGATLFVRSLHNLTSLDAGFKSECILIVNVDFDKLQYSQARRIFVAKDLLEKLSAIPAVVSAAQVAFTPVSDTNWDNSVAPDEKLAATSGKGVSFNQPGPGYFKTMGIPMLTGRDFTDHDTLSSPNVAIVNEAFARTVFGSANPVGHTFHMAADAGQTEPVYRVVGQVRNTKYLELREEFRPIAYFPIAQAVHPGASARFVLRISAAGSGVMQSAKSAVAAINPAMAIDFKMLSTQLQDSLLRERLMAMLSAGFGFLAGLLATLGLYGVIAYMVAQRRNEIGIRMALGADRIRVIGLVLREALLLLGLGLIVGSALSVWAGQAASSLLFGLEPHDLVSLISAAALLATIATLASFVPAQRAARLNPTAALRSE